MHAERRIPCQKFITNLRHTDQQQPQLHTETKTTTPQHKSILHKQNLHILQQEEILKNIADRRSIAAPPQTAPSKPPPKPSQREIVHTSEDEASIPEEQNEDVPRSPAKAPEALTDGTSEPAVEETVPPTEKTTNENPEEVSSSKEDDEDSNEH